MKLNGWGKQKVGMQNSWQYERQAKLFPNQGLKSEHFV